MIKRKIYTHRHCIKFFFEWRVQKVGRGGGARNNKKSEKSCFLPQVQERLDPFALFRIRFRMRQHIFRKQIEFT